MAGPLRHSEYRDEVGDVILAPADMPGLLDDLEPHVVAKDAGWWADGEDRTYWKNWRA